MECVSLQDTSITLAHALQTRFGWTDKDVSQCDVEVYRGGACWVVRTGFFRRRKGKRAWISQVLSEESWILLAPDAPKALRKHFSEWYDPESNGHDVAPDYPLGSWLEYGGTTQHYAFICGRNAVAWHVPMRIFRHLRHIRVATEHPGTVQPPPS